MLISIRTLYNVEKEPSILIAKENGEKPYSYTGSMTFSRINQIFAQHQFDPVTRVTVHNYKTMCGMGSHGEGPCIIYLHDSSKDSEADLQAAKSVMRLVTLPHEKIFDIDRFLLLPLLSLSLLLHGNLFLI